jgi:hypothetical protein
LPGSVFLKVDNSLQQDARWFILRPKLPIWLFFGGPLIYKMLVYFTAIMVYFTEIMV